MTKTPPKNKRINKKRFVIAAHPIQQKIMDLVQDSSVDLNKMTLRKIGEEVGLGDNCPQKVKHHLLMLVRYGFLNVVNGKYQIND